jgi:(1->4)-alpha-D-glucan 1-alpha-D-glucosylmutase
MRDPVETLLEQTWRAVAARRTLPESTYRLQFKSDLTFRDAARITPYLAELGITHCYASPYLKARPGSGHGYDIVDHRKLNPELGNEDDYNAWVDTLRQHGMSHILDVVPNHMGIAGNENEWWNDVLENGPSSPYASYFDIDWNSGTRPELVGRVLLPVLGAPYGEVLESQQLKLEFTGGAFAISYFEHRFPIAPRTYASVLGRRLDELEKKLPADDPAVLEFQSILTSIKHLPDRMETDPALVAERMREKEVVKRRLAALVQDNAAVREHLESLVAEFNGRPGEPKSFDLLDDLIAAQAYRLSFWRVAADEINYRRFFDINELAAISAERDEVFLATHGLVLKLLAEGTIAGARIDHVDGLYDPRQYLERLQLYFVLAVARQVYDTESAFRSFDWSAVEGPLREQIADAIDAAATRRGDLPLYVVVEKILGADERLADDWATHGTSGYDFLNQLNGLFVAPARDDFTRLYHAFIADDPAFPEVVYRSKRLVLQSAMSSELHVLGLQLDRIAQKHRWSRDFTLNSLRLALREVIACFPVYRSYIADDGVHESDKKCILRAVRSARNRNPAVSASLFNFVRDTLLQKPPQPGGADDAYHADQRRFAGKFQQVTSPVIAKGIEDTAFYQFNRLLSLNEVGGDPDRFGVAPTSLHKLFAERRERWPRALSTTATHDTKRGEDLRARLNVLSEVPTEWREAVSRWREMNRPHHVPVDELEVPDANEEYFLYQTLVGTWLPEAVRGPWPVVRSQNPNRQSEVVPYHSATADHGLRTTDFVQRIQDYMHKALHEAKVHSSWINPDPAYDDAVKQFVASVLDPEKSQAFLEDLTAFVQRVAHYGYLNSLSQALVKLTAPGVPDTYQGTELWDFSLVDPDNRRPVDYDLRSHMLDELKLRAGDPELCRELLASMDDGRVKLYLMWRALQARKAHPGLFSEGEYLPLEVSGAQAEHVFAFARRHGDHAALVVVPRLLTGVVGEGELPLGDLWADTHLTVPDDLSGRWWRDAFTGELIPGATSPLLSTLLAHLPVALLQAETNS